MRIVSLAPSATEILFELGMGEKIVGRTRFCDYPKEVDNIPSLGGWLDIDYEKLERMKPDLVFTSTFVQDKVVEELKKRGFNVFHVDPITLNDVMESILATGKAVGKYNEAAVIIDKMKSRIIALQSNLISVKHVPNIYVEEWHMPPTASGNWVPDMLKIVKANSIVPVGKRSEEISTKELQEFDPEKIIISWCGFGQNVKPEFIKKLKNRDGYDKIDAVITNRIFIVDDSLLNRPGPRLVKGLEILARMIHPEAFVNDSIENLFEKISSHNEGTIWFDGWHFED